MATKEQYQVYRKRLLAVLEEKAPKKASLVDNLLGKYPGREHAVYVKVCKKYGVTPKKEWVSSSKESQPRAAPTPEPKPTPKPKPKTKPVPKSVSNVKSQPPKQKRRSTTDAKPPNKDSSVKQKLSLLKKTASQKPKKSAVAPTNAKPANKKTVSRRPPSAHRNASKAQSFVKPDTRLTKIQSNTSKVERKPSKPTALKPKSIATKPDSDSEENYDDDDFENYSDDFDDDVQQSPVSISHPPKSIARTEKTVVEREKKPMFVSNVNRPIPNEYRKYPIVSTKTNTVMELCEKTPLQQYLSRCGTEIFSRGLQSYRRRNQTCQTESSDCKEAETQYSYVNPQLSTKEFDTRRLTGFLRRTSKVVEGIILYHNKQSDSNDVRRVLQMDMKSRSYLSPPLQLSCDALLKGRSPIDWCFSPQQSHRLVVAYSCSIDDTYSGALASKGLLCIWNMKQADYPEKILTCNDDISCVTFHCDKQYLVFAGKKSGCIAVWDLREPSSQHSKIKISCVGGGKKVMIARNPTYESESLWNANHLYPVSKIIPLPTADHDLSYMDEFEMGYERQSSFQMYSIDTDSVVNVWTVVELREDSNSKLLSNALLLDNSDAKSDESQRYIIDFGLRDGGRVKILQSRQIQLKDSIPSYHKPIQTYCSDMCMNPFDTNSMLVSFGSRIYHIDRTNDYSIKQTFDSNKSQIGITQPIASNVTTAVFSPLLKDQFLVGFDNGCVCLFNLNQSNPVKMWTDMKDNTAVVSIQWSDKYDSVFFVLFNNQRFRMWNTIVSDQFCVSERKLESKSELKIRSSSVLCQDSFICIPSQENSLSIHYIRDGS